MYWVPATGSPFTPSNVSGTTITVSSTSNLTAGMYVESATYNINTTISSITNLTQFVVASATNITTSTPLNIGTWVTAVVGAQGVQGSTGAQGATGTSTALATVNLTTQSAAQAATTLYTPASDGLFTITYYAKVTTAATTSSTLGVFSVISTDTDSNVVTTVGQSTQQNSLTAGFISGSITVYAKASTAIQYSLGYASSGATAMQYELRIVVAGTIAPSVSGTVSSFNGRTGAVTPASGDYTFSQVSGTAALATQVSGTLPVANGGTNLTTFTAANNAIYSTSASAITAGTLPVLAGGTGVTTSTGSGNNVLSASPTLTGTITETGTTIVTQTGGSFSSNDDETMTIMGAWI
jgi:hypothetical protein